MFNTITRYKDIAHMLKNMPHTVRTLGKTMQKALSTSLGSSDTYFRHFAKPLHAWWIRNEQNLHFLAKFEDPREQVPRRPRPKPRPQSLTLPPTQP